jgi:hypothetical protein
MPYGSMEELGGVLRGHVDGMEIELYIRQALEAQRSTSGGTSSRHVNQGVKDGNPP